MVLQIMKSGNEGMELKSGNDSMEENLLSADNDVQDDGNISDDSGNGHDAKAVDSMMTEWSELPLRCLLTAHCIEDNNLHRFQLMKLVFVRNPF